jgi:hypothetical protein
MTETATPGQAQGERRVELRLSPSEHQKLQDSARLALRSTSGQARHLLVRALAAEQHGTTRGAAG